MSEPVRYEKYTPGTTCSVPECSEPAEYEVYLYDFYAYLNKEFFQQDFTCPFLCREHMEQNEREIQGERRPRTCPNYPFSNRNLAQGYTKYAPIKELFPALYMTATLAEGKRIIIATDEVNKELVVYLAQHPELMYELQPRRFEELVAELLRSQGFDPTLTPTTRDGGRDIIATRSDRLGTLLYVIECKRYAPENKVGVAQVRGIYGVVQAERASKAVLVTTSHFTNEAIKFAQPLQYNLTLRDFDALKEWLQHASLIR